MLALAEGSITRAVVVGNVSVGSVQTENICFFVLMVGGNDPCSNVIKIKWPVR